MSSALLSHRCQHCAREFSRAEHLVRHERIHTKEKPFACNLCNQAFSRRDLLRRHDKKIHNSPSRVVIEASQGTTSSRSYDNVPTNFLQSQSVSLGVSSTNSLLGTNQVGDHGWIPHGNGSPGELLPMNLDSLDNAGSQNWFLPDDYLWAEQLGDIGSVLDLNEGSPERHENQTSIGERGSLLSRPGSPPIIDLPRDIAYSPSSINSTSDFRITPERYTLAQDEVQSHTMYSLPPRERLSQFIYRYFESFHRHQPFLHPATWSPQTAETSLILAICASGALYSLEAEVASELNRAATLCMHTEKKGSSTLQTYMISTAFLAWGGQRDNIGDALQRYGDIILSVREIWSQKSLISTHVTSSNWVQWIEMESLKRVTFCLFTLMNLMTISYDIPAPLMLENRFGLPCHEIQWQAGSEEEWKTLMTNTEQEHTMSASDIIDQLCNEDRPVPQQVGIFGCHVIISSLVQRIMLFRKSNLQQDMNFHHTQQKFYYTLRRWQKMWENEPKEGLSPNSQYGPMLFNSTALLRFAYVRLATDYSSARSLFSWCDSIDMIVNSIVSMDLPPRNHISTRAALHACLALKIPARLGVRLVARTSFWVWSVQHALCYFECALLLGMWLEKLAQDRTGISHEEAEIIDLIQQVINKPGPRNDPDDFREMKASVFRVWGQLLDTGVTTVWALIPKLAQVLTACAERNSY